MKSESLSQINYLLAAARDGDTDSLGRLFEIYRNYIAILASTQVRNRLRVRASASDIVQDTFMNAHRGFGEFRGTTGNEFVVWLRTILTRRIQNLVKQHVGTQARDVRKEVSIDAIAKSIDDSSVRLDAVFQSPDLTPCTHLQTHLRSLQVADSLAGLNEDHRQVLVLRHIDGLDFPEIARRMHRTQGSTRTMWVRAIRALRDQLNEGRSE
ncbi:MAG: sigma-70 family RNA polymerase sigma factor [Planctomycetota bacterium]